MVVSLSLIENSHPFRSPPFVPLLLFDKDFFSWLELRGPVNCAF